MKDKVNILRDNRQGFLRKSNKSNEDALLLDDQINELYGNLRPFVTSLVRRIQIPTFMNQRYDIVEDAMQETVFRVMQRYYKALAGTLPPIESLRFFAMRTAANYIRDCLRKEKRIFYLATESTETETDTTRTRALIVDIIDLAELAEEQVLEEQIFKAVAPAIAQFPGKIRVAILTDFASRMFFGATPSLLQREFLRVGIDLCEYKDRLPVEALEKKRYNSLLSIAYKRLRSLACVQPYLIA